MAVVPRSGYTRFRAKYDYEPKEGCELRLRKGDILSLAQAVDDYNGWMVGTNERTDLYGDFPGTFVEPITEESSDSLQRNRTKSPPPISVSPIIGVQSNKHCVKEIHFVKPTWCLYCSDYIWGHRSGDCFCTVCKLSSHQECVSVFTTMPCQPDPEQAGLDIRELTKPVENWSDTEVLQWICASRLYHAFPVFYKKRFGGNSLTFFNQESIKSILDIDNDDVCFAVHQALLELIRGDSTKAGVDLQDRAGVLTSASSSVTIHSFAVTTFPQTKWCDLCGRILFGTVKQGLQCQSCKLKAHRFCIYGTLPPCFIPYPTGKKGNGTQLSHVDSAVSKSLEDSAREALLASLDFIEKIPIDQSRMYYLDGPHHTIPGLYGSLLEDADKAVMEQAGILNMGSVVKLLLWSLPEPPIPYAKYDAVLEAAVQGSSELGDWLNRLDFGSQTLLSALLRHFKRLLASNSGSKVSRTDIINCFSLVLLLPPDSRLVDIPKNYDSHLKVIASFLEFDVSKDGAFCVISKVLKADELVQYEDWFWGSISREEACEYLRNRRDGTYLVRVSTDGTMYTLHVTVDGEARGIHIKENNGFYGFSELCVFKSVVDLVQHYQRTSLSELSGQIRTFLRYPFTKDLLQSDYSEYMSHKSFSSIPETSSDMQLTESMIQNMETTLNTKQSELRKLEEQENQLARSLESLEMQRNIKLSLANMYEEHITLNERLMQEGPVENKKYVEENGCLLQQKWTGIMLDLQEIDLGVPTVKLELESIRSQRLRLSRYTEDIAKQLDSIKVDLPDYLWYVGNMPKTLVCEALTNKVDGTFLVRKSETQEGSWVISLAYEGSPKHIRVVRYCDGFGFENTGYRFDSLQQMINYYHRCSLSQCSVNIDTRLAYPIGDTTKSSRTMSETYAAPKYPRRYR